MIFKRIWILILFLNALVLADEIVEPLPSINVQRISDYEINEKDASTKKAIFRVTLSESPSILSGGLTLNYVTDNWGATKGVDYLGEDGSLYFAPFQTEKEVEFTIVNDTLKGGIDPDEQVREYFNFRLTDDSVDGYVFNNKKAHQLIMDDDVYALAYGWGNYVLEGDENSTSKVTFYMGLNQPLDHNLTLHYNTIDDSAKAGVDYKSSSGDIVFKKGETWKKVNIDVIGDKIKEALYEKFYLHLTTSDPDFQIPFDMRGNIIDDDIPNFYVSAGVEKLEGNSGQTCIPFDIKLTKPINETSSVFFSTYDGTAKVEYNDYTPIENEEVIFAPNETQKQVCVYVNGDTKVEADEDVGIWLDHSSPNTEITTRTEGDGTSRNVANLINNDDNATHTAGTCTSDMFISRSLDNRMFISKIDISQNPFKFNMLEEAGSEDIYNALIYSEVDNFMYALDKRELLQIGINGTIVKMGQVTGLPDIYNTKQLFGGATYGGYYYVTGTATPMEQIFKIKISDKSVQTITLDKAVDLLDISPTPDGKYLYGIDNKKKLTKVELATGHVEFIGSDHTDVQFDTTYSDVNGKFYANDSGGKGFYEINLLTGEKAFRSPSSKATFNDGANCINAPLVFTDFGDAPSSYGDASHNIIGNLTLGKNIDHDISPYYSYDAMGDDVNGSDDEDGVVMNDANKTEVSMASLYPNIPYSFSVDASNSGYLTAWIDYNLNGTFEDTEKIASSLAVVKGDNIVNFTSPATLELFKTSFVRFRFSSTPVVSAVGLVGDGEVEDYKINFGPAKKPIKANFNIERVNSNPAGGDFNLYTQISGRDFDFSVVAYEDKNNSTTPQALSDVTVKVELFDVQNNKELLYTKYVYFPKDNNGTKRINIVEPNDLALNLASRDLNFKVTSLVDSSGFIIQGDFSDDAKFNSMMNAIKKVNSAKDDFAIRPASFDVSIMDNTKVLAKNTLRLSAGYTYNLSPTARLYNPAGVGGNVKNYTGLLDSSVLKFDDSNTSCIDTQDVEVKGIDFKDGIGKKEFSHHNSGRYRFRVRDNMWSQIDSTQDGCIADSSVVSTSPNEKSGCDIASADINMSFYPYKFGLDNIVVKNSNDSTHKEFVYMNNLADDESMSLSLEGDIEAQNFNGGITTNFSSGCGSEDVNLAVEYSGKSDEGAFENISTGKIFTKHHRYQKAFLRKDTINATSQMKNADDAVLVGKANIKNGVSSAKMLFNIERDMEEMNPIQIQFETIVATSPNSYSSANGVDNYVPTGARVLNAMRMFYYARLTSDKINYPITYDGEESTPIYAEIYCNHTVDFCKKMIGSNGLNGSRTQQGWYTSIKHESGVDGQVLEVKETAINTSLVSTVGDYNIMSKGKTTNLITKYTGSNPMDSKMEITNISPWLKFNNQYWFNHFRQTKEGKWAGVGKTGHTVKIDTNGTTSKKVDW